MKKKTGEKVENTLKVENTEIDTKQLLQLQNICKKLERFSSRHLYN